MNIGKTIKKLRKLQNLSQEKLAEYFNVTPQAVSKWENGTAYPDVTMLPSIANYFNITLDELFSMDEIRSEKRINSIFAKSHGLLKEGNTEEAIRLLKSAVKTYPNNYSLISELALALTLNNDDESNREAIELSERVLENSANEKVRSTTMANLCFLYIKSGLHDKAASLARTLPHIWECREILSVYAAETDNQADVLKSSINIILNVLCGLIDKNTDNNIFVLGAERGQRTDTKAMLDKIYLFLE